MKNKTKKFYVSVAAIAGIVFLNIASVILTILIADILDNTTEDNEVIWVVSGIFLVVSVVFGLGIWVWHHYREE